MTDQNDRALVNCHSSFQVRLSVSLLEKGSMLADSRPPGLPSCSQKLISTSARMDLNGRLIHLVAFSAASIPVTDQTIRARIRNHKKQSEDMLQVPTK